MSIHGPIQYRIRTLVAIGQRGDAPGQRVILHGNIVALKAETQLVGAGYIGIIGIIRMGQEEPERLAILPHLMEILPGTSAVSGAYVHLPAVLQRLQQRLLGEGHALGAAGQPLDPVGGNGIHQGGDTAGEG